MIVLLCFNEFVPRAIIVTKTSSKLGAGLVFHFSRRPYSCVPAEIFDVYLQTGISCLFSKYDFRILFRLFGIFFSLVRRRPSPVSLSNL